MGGSRSRMPSCGSAHASTVLPYLGVAAADENAISESGDSSTEISSGDVVELVAGGDVGIVRLAPLALLALVSK